LKLFFLITVLVTSLFPWEGLGNELDALLSLEESAVVQEGTSIAPQVDYTLDFELTANSKVEEPYVYLGKISNCRGPMEKCLELSSVELGRAPMPGEKRRIGREEIQLILEKEMGEDSAHVSMSGSEVVIVEAIFENLSRYEVQRVLQDELDRITNEDLKFEVLSVQLPKPLAKRPGDFSISFSELSQASPDSLLGILGNRKHGATLVQEGTAVPFTFFANLKASRKVPVAVKSIDKGSILSSDDFILGWQPVGFRQNDVTLSVKDLGGMMVTRTIGSGEAVNLNWIKKPELVKRGQMVRVGVTGNGINISGQAKAIESGGAGDQIKVLFADTKKVVSGVIKNDGTIEVTF
jgi:flagella basal body P-ring formation protein FlgA